MLKKKLWRVCTNFWINPHNGKLPSRLAPAQYQNSLTPQLLSNIYWSKAKTSISLNRVYWYDTMCHIFSCLCKLFRPFTILIARAGNISCFSWFLTTVYAIYSRNSIHLMKTAKQKRSVDIHKAEKGMLERIPKSCLDHWIYPQWFILWRFVQFALFLF